MKRIAVLGLCLCIFPYCAMTAFAEDTPPPNNNAVIEVSVPSEHTLTVIAPDGVTVFLNGKSGVIFNVERLSEPIIEVKVPDGQEVVKVTLNGEDITDKFVNGQYKLPPVYENLALEVETKAAEPTTSTTEPTTSTTNSTTSSEGTSPTTSDSSTSSGNPTTSSSTDTRTDNSQSGTTSSQGNVTPADSRTYPNNDSPNTGDMAHAGLWSSLILSFGVIAVLAKRKKDDDE